MLHQQHGNCSKLALTDAEVSLLLKVFAINPSTDLVRHDLIGKSVVSNVYKGYWQLGGKEVAIKHLFVQQPQALYEQLLRYLRPIACDYLRVRNFDNIVACYGVWDKPPAVCLVLEYSQIGSLKNALSNARSYPFAWEDRCSLALNIAKGMRYLHRSLGVTHGKLSSSNVLLFKQEGRLVAKVSDYSLLPLQNIIETDTFHRPGSAKSGSLHRNPSVLAGGIPTEYTDVYDFGLLLYELATGHRFASTSAPLDLSQLPFPPGCPDEMRNITCRCLAANAEARPDFDQIVKSLGVAMDEFLMQSVASTDNHFGSWTPFAQVNGNTNMVWSPGSSGEASLMGAPFLQQGFSSTPREPSDRAFTFAELDAVCRDLSSMEDGPCIHAAQVLQEFTRSSKANHDWLRSTRAIDLLVKVLVNSKSEDVKVHVAGALEGVAWLGDSHRLPLLSAPVIGALRKLLKYGNEAKQHVVLSALCVILQKLSKFGQLSNGVVHSTRGVAPSGCSYSRNDSSGSERSSPAVSISGSITSSQQPPPSSSSTVKTCSHLQRFVTRALSSKEATDSLETHLEKLVPLLLSITRRGDDGAVSKSFYLLRELMSVPRLKSVVLGNSGLVATVISCLGVMGDAQCQTHAAELLWCLVTAGEDQAQLAIDNNAIGVLTSILQEPHSDARLAVASISCLVQLARNSKGSRLMMHTGGVEVALKLLQCGRDDIAEGAAAVVEQLADSLEAQRQLVANQAVKILVGLLSHGTTPGLQVKVAKSLRLIAENWEHHGAFLECDAITSFVAQLKATSQPQLRSELAFLLFYFGGHMHATRVPILEAVGAIDVLCQWLELPEQPRKSDYIVCECCTRALTDVSRVSSSARHKLVSGDAVRQLALLLHCSNEGCRDAAVGALAELALNRDVRLSIVSYGAMTPLAQLLTVEDAAIQKVATDLVAKLSAEPENRVEIAPCISTLADLLILEDPPEFSTRALAYLTQDSRYAGRLACLPGVLENLMNIVESGEKVCQRPATEVLKNICELSPRHRANLCDLPDAVPSLLHIVSSETDSCRQRCLKTLLALSDDCGHRCSASASLCAQQFNSAEGTEVLLNLLRSHATSDTYRTALSLLWNVALKGPVAHEWEGSHAQLLVKFLSHQDVLCQQAAAGVISCITFNHRSNQQVLVEAGVVEPLMNMLSHESQEVHTTALEAICNISFSNPAAQHAVASMGGIQVLHRFLSQGSPTQQIPAALAYRNLAQDEQLKQQVIQAGVLPDIIGLLMTPPDPPSPSPFSRDDLMMLYVAAFNALSTLTHNDGPLLEFMLTQPGLLDQVLNLWLSCGDNDALLLSSSALLSSLLSCAPECLDSSNIVMLQRLLGMMEEDNMTRKREAGARLLLGFIQALGSSIEYMLLEIGGLARIAKMIEDASPVVRLCGVKALLGLAICPAVRDRLNVMHLQAVLTAMARESSGSSRESVETLMLMLGLEM